VDRAAFADGSTVDYNSVSNTLTVNVSGAGNVILNSANVTVNASNQVTLNTPHTICKGQLTVEGAFTYLAGMVGSGGGANSAQITGGVAFSGGELIHNGKNIGATHTHGNVQNGNGSTSPPL
jgi:phage baseplate assembly protein gpV